MPTSAEVTRGRPIARQSAVAGIWLVKPIKVWHESKSSIKFGIPLSRYIEAQKAPCLDDIASWIMETPLSFIPDRIGLFSLMTVGAGSADTSGAISTCRVAALLVPNHKRLSCRREYGTQEFKHSVKTTSE
ncbi:hypothetical protein OE88DRAFT_1647995 [Heliocybe sulcata]|uniref:Uncharacterized protein n=1 Tax=Heliocybe sulcata TaxID=5364 RepID=A0A5C3MNQ2_9AGAM|nr:hypothetical protein OE88DRAFT_1647995 [Heliocybe sulcata]